MAGYLKPQLYLPHVLLRKQSSSVLFDLFGVHHFLEFRVVQQFVLEKQFDLLVIPQTLILEGGNFGSNLEAFGVVE